MYWWITFSDRNGGCVEGTEDEARLIASKFGTVLAVERLPYAASPYLHPIDAPPFCYSPMWCKGRLSCPKQYACSE